MVNCLFLPTSVPNSNVIILFAWQTIEFSRAVYIVSCHLLRCVVGDNSLVDVKSKWYLPEDQKCNVMMIRVVWCRFVRAFIWYCLGQLATFK